MGNADGAPRALPASVSEPCTTLWGRFWLFWGQPWERRVKRQHPWILKNPSPEPCSLQLQTPNFVPQPPKNPSPMPVQPPPHGTPPRGVQCPSLVRGVGVSDAHVWRRADVVQRCVQLGASSAPDKKPPPLPGIDFVQPITAFPQQLIPGCSPPLPSGGGSPRAQRRRLVTPIISTAPRLAGHVVDFS